MRLDAPRVPLGVSSVKSGPVHRRSAARAWKGHLVTGRLPAVVRGQPARPQAQHRQRRHRHRQDRQRHGGIGVGGPLQADLQWQGAGSPCREPANVSVAPNSPGERANASTAPDTTPGRCGWRPSRGITCRLRRPARHRPPADHPRQVGEGHDLFRVSGSGHDHQRVRGEVRRVALQQTGFGDGVDLRREGWPENFGGGALCSPGRRLGGTGELEIGALRRDCRPWTAVRSGRRRVSAIRGEHDNRPGGSGRGRFPGAPGRRAQQPRRHRTSREPDRTPTCALTGGARPRGDCGDGRIVTQLARASRRRGFHCLATVQ